MNTYLEKHSATNFVTNLKEKLRGKEEKVKSRKQEEETKKERGDDDEKKRMRRRGEMMMNEDEARWSLLKRQERLTSSLLLLRCSPVVKRVTRRTINYFRLLPPPRPSPLTPQPSLPGLSNIVAAPQVLAMEKDIRDALHIRLCQVVEQCAPRGVYTRGQERRDPPAAPPASSTAAPGRAWARTSSRRPAGAPTTPRGRTGCSPARSFRPTLHISRPPTLPALPPAPWQYAPAPSIIPPLTWPLPQALRPSCSPPEEQEEDDDEISSH